MSNNPFDVESYNATMQFEVIKLFGIGILLLVVLITMVVFSIVLIKADKTKKNSVCTIGCCSCNFDFIDNFFWSINYFLFKRYL